MFVGDKSYAANVDLLMHMMLFIWIEKAKNNNVVGALCTLVGAGACWDVYDYLGALWTPYTHLVCKKLRVFAFPL